MDDGQEVLGPGATLSLAARQLLRKPRPMIEPLALPFWIIAVVAAVLLVRELRRKAASSSDTSSDLPDAPPHTSGRDDSPACRCAPD